MNIVVCNIGSTSLKFQLLDMPAELQLARGSAERVGSREARVTYWHGASQSGPHILPLSSHGEAVEHALGFLTGGAEKILPDLSAIGAVGFKTVQAGEKNGSVLLTQDVLESMEEYRDLAPAHNPPYIEAIRMFRERLPGTPLVGVFEPGFHTTLPGHARIYGVPYDWYERYGVRRYGYHGASHRYVAGEVIRILGLSPGKNRIVSCHLGGSSSLCAVKNGTSLDTSMGFTPQSGLLQGTRVGDVDPFVFPYIMAKRGITLTEALRECTQQGGLLGISGISSDMRDIAAAAAEGNARARLAREKFIYDVKRYLGEYLVLLEGLDAVVFTGGIGEHDADLRMQVLSSLGFIGLRLDEENNKAHARLITAPGSSVVGLVIPSDEEIVVARETLRVVQEISHL